MTLSMDFVAWLYLYFGLSIKYLQPEPAHNEFALLGTL